MYVGRIVAVGWATGPFAAYRVSSRSYPNRQAVPGADIVSIMPRPGYEEDMSRNPYIAYNCLRIVGDAVVVSNGSHTEPIAEKLAAGYSPRDAIALPLLTMDYEKDDYNTPRIAGIIRGDMGCLGIVRDDGLQVESFPLAEGHCRVVATYELNRVTDEEHPVSAITSIDVAEWMVDGDFFRDLEHPICATAWMDGIAVFNVGAEG